MRRSFGFADRALLAAMIASAWCEPNANAGVEIRHNRSALSHHQRPFA